MPDKVNPILAPKDKPKFDLKKLHECTAALHADVATARTAKGMFDTESFNLQNFLKNLALILQEVGMVITELVPPTPAPVASEPVQSEKK